VTAENQPEHKLPETTSAPQSGTPSCEQQTAEPTAAPPAVNPDRAAAVAKLKAALFAAALEKMAERPAPSLRTFPNTSEKSATNQQPLVNNGGGFKMAGKNVPGGIKRSLSTGDSAPAADLQQQHRPLIWDFFQEGRTVGTCRCVPVLYCL
jgi:hypothetical protein